MGDALPPNRVSLCDQGLRSGSKGQGLQGYQNPQAPEPSDCEKVVHLLGGHGVGG